MANQQNQRTRYQQVADSVREDIRQGRYAPGDKIPSMWDLAQAFGFSELTVDRGLKALQAEGYVAIRHGMGTFVLDRPADDLEQLHAQAKEIRDLVAAHLASIEKAQQSRKAAAQEGP